MGPPNWVQGYVAFWQSREAAARQLGDSVAAAKASQHASNALAFSEHLRGITEQYQVAYIELDRDLSIDKVCDIFTQINSRGVRLDIFDLMNALLKPKGLQLKLLWREARPKLEFASTDRMNVYVLQVMSILLQAYCSPKYLYYLLPGQAKSVRNPDGTLRKEVLVPSTVSFEQHWRASVDGLDKALSLLRHPQEFGAIASRFLPYVSILPAFAAIQAAVRKQPANRQLDAQRKARHWYWASVFTNRYSGSVESTSTRDFLDVDAWLGDESREPSVIQEFRNRFRELDLRRETKSGSSVYNGIFNLLVLRGARDWMTGNVPQYGDLDDHHIVPQAWGRDNGLGDVGDSILNRTPMTEATNRGVIHNRLPNEYLPALVTSNGERIVRATLESHFISATAFDILLRDPFTLEDYDAFITERQRTILDAIENLLIKERLDLAPQLRELDAEVELIELGLRMLVAQALGGAAERLPPHISVKIEERIQSAARKNPAVDSPHYKTLDGKLEYFDLREVQDTISSKSLWSLFEGRFGSKELLATRFGQLAELRNGIRHSRSVDEVTRKDGEAAIMWFRMVLAKCLPV